MDIITKISYCCTGVALLYFGGWDILWDHNLNMFGLLAVGAKSSYIGETGIFYRINSSWYGLFITKRFFDSPSIQWMMGSAAFFLIFFPGVVKRLRETNKTDATDAKQKQ